MSIAPRRRVAAAKHHKKDSYSSYIHSTVATCPKCGGFLNEHHRCRGARRKIGSVAAVAAVGAMLGFFASFSFVDHPTSPLMVVTAMLGAILAGAIARAARQ